MHIHVHTSSVRRRYAHHAAWRYFGFFYSARQSVHVCGQRYDPPVPRIFFIPEGTGQKSGRQDEKGNNTEPGRCVFHGNDILLRGYEIIGLPVLPNAPMPFQKLQSH